MAENNQTVYQTGLTNGQIFNGMNSFGSDEIAYHSISTDHPFMRDIGLSVFTIQELYRWMQYRDYTGEFVNLKYFLNANSSSLRPNETVENRILDAKLGNIILGTSGGQASACPEDYNTWMSFGGWRRSGRSGKYELFKLFEWNFYDKYKFQDLDWNYLNNKGFFLEKQPGPSDGTYRIFESTDKYLDDIVCKLIALNDLARFLPVLRDFYIPNSNTIPTRYLAAYEFINDIKSSQAGCISWKSNIMFSTYVGYKRCVKTECVKFTLHLYDDTNRRSLNRPIAFNSKNLFIALPQHDAFGRDVANNGTGDVNLSTNQNTTIAQLALTINPSDGKAYSGSPTVLVQLDTPLPAALHNSGNNNSEILDTLDPGKNNQHIPGTGLAIPMTEQNGNAIQWAASYKQPRCSKKDNSRFTIVVNNHHNTSFPSGAVGYATKLNGESLWSFMPIGNYEKSIDSTPRNWSFTYLMMNADNFFVGRPLFAGGDANTGTFYNSPEFDALDYEAIVYDLYYNNPVTSAPGEPSRYHFLDTFPAIQISSWDFMDPSIGGWRNDGHALSTTVFNLDNDGRAWPDYELGKYSTPFFGCVFPDGYDTLGKNYYNASSQEIHVKNSVGDPFDKPTSFLDSFSDDYPFIKNISQGTLLFDNSKTDAINRLEGEQDFNKGIFQGQLATTLNHLPADIATNSSPYDPKTQHGNPLINYYHIYRAFQIFDGGSVVNGVPSFITSSDYQKMIKNIVGSGYKNEGKSDFSTKYVWAHPAGKPEQSAFGFKPLNPYKIQFRPLKHEVYDCLQGINGTGTENFNRGRWARSARNYQRTNNPPLTSAIWQRNGILRKEWKNFGSFLLNPGADEGMLINAVSAETGGKTLRHNYSLANKKKLQKWAVNRGYFPRFWADFNWLDSSDINSGAYGVIGAACTMTFSRRISFQTNSVFGMRSSFGPSNILFPKPWYQAFGGLGDNYDDYQTTQLWLRIYHHWPKEYTIYDPSKFAIFHFNPENETRNNIDWIFDEEGYIKRGEGIDPNLRICSDGIIVVDAPFAISSIINTERHGKLLPYKYKLKHTIGIPLGPVWGNGSEAGAATPKNYAIVIDNQGAGYIPTDLFQIAGGNGVSPILVPIVDGAGKITGFNYKDPNHRGYNYQPKDFLASNTNFLQGGGLKIIPLDSHTGINFSGRVVRGISTESPELEDAKPKSVGASFIQLTLGVPVRESPNATIMEPVTGLNNITINLSEANKSEDDQYDLFFHFHNDTSHTFIDDYGSAPIEQYVELTISPD